MADTYDWATEKARELMSHAIREVSTRGYLEPLGRHIASALRDARREALEEAALVAERNPEPYIPMRIRALAAGGKAE